MNQTYFEITRQYRIFRTPKKIDILLGTLHRNFL